MKACYVIIIFLLIFFSGTKVTLAQTVEAKFKKLDSLLTLVRDTNDKMALEIINKQKEIYSKLKSDNNNLNVTININLSKYYKNINQLDSSIKYGVKAYERAIINNKLQQISSTSNNLGLLFKNNHRNDSALKYFKISYNVNLKISDSAGMAANIHGISSIYSKTKNYDTAIFYLKKSLVYTDSNKSPNDYATIKNSIGYNGYLKGDYKLALSNYFSSLNIYKSTQNWKREIMCLEQIGAVFYEEKDYKSALIQFNLANEIAENKKLKSKIASLTLNIGAIYYEVGEILLAVKNFKKAEQKFTELNNLNGLAAVYTNLGEIYINQNDFINAESSILKGIALDKKMGNIGQLSQSYYSLGNCFIKQNKTLKAKEAFEASLTLAENSGKIKTQLSNFKKIIPIYISIGSKEKSINSFNKYIVLQDSLNYEKNQTIINDLKFKYETELKEVENIRLKNELELKKTKITASQNKLWFIIIISITLFTIFILTTYTLFNKIKIKKQEVYQKEKEKLEVYKKLNESKKTIIENNYVINSLKKEIELEFNKGDFTENLLNKISSDNNWVNFMGEFEVLHKNFFKNLKLKHPNLTKNDLRLAALIKLNLSDKELSELLNIEYSSLKKSKNRLKKKLNLLPENKLSEYICDF